MTYSAAHVDPQHKDIGIETALRRPQSLCKPTSLIQKMSGQSVLGSLRPDVLDEQRDVPERAHENANLKIKIRNKIQSAEQPLRFQGLPELAGHCT